jgi:membrane associated rhomboid family serine protease
VAFLRLRARGRASTTRAREPLARPELGRSLRAIWREAAHWLLAPVAGLWLIELVDQLLWPAPGLDVYGIRPRSEAGLWGILFAPWLHRGFAHLAANSLPLLIFASLVLTRGRRELLRVTAWVVMLGGLGVWLIGSAQTIHLGASGLVFGYLGYLLAVGWIERHFAWIVVSMVVAFLYGGLLRGVLPGIAGVSWESHLCGLLAGVIAARREKLRRGAV